ncbi:MAG: hypothetical protein QXS51_04905 [Thermoproteota archaeon]|nr:hypothetical protein [Candidatus Brockarchaeota archaeon]
MRQRIAEIVSYVLSNPVTGGFGGLAILYKEAVLNNLALYIVMIIFFYSILPFSSVYYLRLKGKTDIFMSERSRRPRHFIPGLLGYTLSAFFFKSRGMSLLAVTSVAYFSTSLVLLFFTLKTKISIHVSGLATVGMLIYYFYGLPGLIVLMLLPLLAWARVNTGEHTYLQTVLGALVGLIVTALTLMMLNP